ncbi:Retrovirus-related Pol polyprotein like [Argiope bruennichi]|uniref:Retrovirus-related Pol polyprotein like n=1 Tax=Argiope bruennichi TaxID=94029 RepID=A0A8T0FWR5_ARGBR|nr:Retrovirus-related Pol polyprotein like [Argiope bruennichi]
MVKGAAIASYEPVVDIVIHPQEFSGKQPILSILENIEGLNEDQRIALQKLLQEFQHLFSTCDADVGRCNVTQHKINTGDHPPIKQYPRRLPLARKEEAERLVKEMVDSGIIEESSGPWASPLSLLRRKTDQHADVEKSGRECHVCGARKGPKTRTKGRLQRYNVDAPFERMALDILGPFPATTNGNRYVLVLMEYFTKWPAAIPIPDQGASTIAEELVRSWISHYGVPMILHSDQEALVVVVRDAISWWSFIVFLVSKFSSGLLKIQANDFFFVLVGYIRQFLKKNQSTFSPIFVKVVTIVFLRSELTKSSFGFFSDLGQLASFSYNQKGPSNHFSCNNCSPEHSRDTRSAALSARGMWCHTAGDVSERISLILNKCPPILLSPNPAQFRHRVCPTVNIGIIKFKTHDYSGL